jgi:hypothetical protein
METARMNYYFTGVLIILFVILCFMEPAYPRNEYLNDGTNTCSTGSFDVSVEQRASEYYHRPYDPANAYSNPSDDQSIRLTWRKYLGSACTKEFRKVQTENAQLKQQLELMKMCGKVNNNPTIARNPNFALLVQKCSGIIIPENKKPDNSHWDDLKDNYKEENPDLKLMGDKFIGPNE